MSYQPFEPEFANAVQRHVAVALEQRLTGVAARALGAGILAVVALLWVALASWSVTDPSLTHATSGEIRNLMGPIGAIVSDLLLQTFGLAAIVILAGPLFWGLELFYSGRVARLKSKLAFLPIAVGVLAGAISALPVSSIWPLNHGYGGILGDAIFAGVANLLALVNAQRAGAAAGLLLFAGGFAALSHVVGIAFADVAEAVRGHRAGTSGKVRRLRAEHAASPVAPHLDMPLEANGRDVSAPARDRHRDTNPAHFDGVSGRTHRDLARTHGADRDPSREHSRQPVVHYPMAAAPHAAADAWPGPAHDVRGAGPSDLAAHGALGADGQPLPPVANYRPYVPPHPPGPGMMRAPSRGPAAALAPLPTSATPRAPELPPMPHVQPVHQAPLSPPRSTEFADPRDDSFDDATDFDSPSIAARFAPEGAAPNPAAAPFTAYTATPREPHRTAATFDEPVRTQQPHALDQPPMPVAPAEVAAARQFARQSASPAAPQARRRNALFGGLTFRHQGEPAFRRPSLNLLRKPMPVKAGAELAQTALRGNARLLEDVLADFGVKGEIRDIRPGPVVTMYEMEPARGTKSSRVIGLADDIARSMSANAVRVAVVPGRNAIGIELPNPRRQTVLLRELLEADSFKNSELTLPITLGKSIGGEPVIADLARMPHLLVAGTTGSGKSVGVNAMILSLLYRLTPEECRFIMIDPKMLELSVYNGIPHLLTPVVTDPVKAVAALEWAVSEMEERYKRMAKLSVRNIDVFNNRVKNARKRGEMLARTVQTGFDKRTGEAIYEQEKLDLEPMPYIVVVIDEFADLMLVVGKEVEAAVQRLAQMARAAGIHIIMATQRPSVDVITGTIKANFPTRISFKVTSKIDSRTILNEQGAEQLLGQGDMLYAAGSGQIVRVHGPFVADEEVEAIAAALRDNGPPDYIAGIAEPQAVPQGGKKGAGPGAGDDGKGQQSEQDLYDRAVATVLRDRKASTSYIQRRLSIGYNRAADLIERMEREGVISPANATGKRDILIGAGGIAEADMDAA